jgi:hypothetical protein
VKPSRRDHHLSYLYRQHRAKGHNGFSEWDNGDTISPRRTSLTGKTLGSEVVTNPPKRYVNM